MQFENTILLVIFALLIIVIITICVIVVRRAEKEKKAALQQASDAKTEFLSRISNDIKIPMNVIVGMTALGMEDTDNPEKMAECLEKIDTASHFLMGLLNDLVDVSKIEMGRFRLHPKAYAFSDFVDSLRIMMEPMCAEKQIEFELIGEEININIMADPMRFEQMFLNLLNNAVKFTPQGGKVSFKVCNYAVHNNQFSADYVVKDNGIGMSEEFQKLLFEPFSQEMRDVAHKRHGAGLGLAIVQNVVELMGGKIDVRSSIGEGTEVKVHLDLDLAQIQPDKGVEKVNEERIRATLKGKRVLLVEDHPLNTEIAKRILERYEMRITAVEDGATAIDLFEKSDLRYFDVVLMDIVMPEMDGFEAARRIRKIGRADAQITPIIAMSASDTQEDVDACKEAGMNAHIAKPVEPQKLYQILCEYLENPI